MLSNRIRAHLLLKSRYIEADAIVRLVGLAADHLGRIGEPVGETSRSRRDHNVCYFSTEEKDEVLGDGPMIGDVVKELLDRIAPSASAWQPLVLSGQLEGVIVCEIWVEAKYSPSIDFSAEILSRVATLGIGLTFDFYWWP